MAESLSQSSSRSAHSTSGRFVPAAAHDDAALPARIRGGDVVAFEAMFAAHYQTLYTLAHRYLGAREPAEDAVQDVFRRIWTRHAEWEPRVPVRAYLITATRNECLSALRHDRLVRGTAALCANQGHTPGMGTAGRDVDADIAAGELAIAIEEVAVQLAPKCREVFLRRWRDGLSVAETAQGLGISTKSVEAHMTRALCLLRERLPRHLAP